MKKVMEALRGVVGVSGVVIWDRVSNDFHRLLPARMTDEIGAELENKLMQLCRISEHNRRSVARFQKGWLFVYNHPQFAILILGKPDLNTTTLHLVLKSAVATLESIARIEARTEEPQVTFHPDHAHILARAINLCIGFYQGKFSRAEVAEMLRDSKNELLPEYPVLKNFTVDNNGGVIVIRGAAKTMDATAIGGTAMLIRRFSQKADPNVDSSAFSVEKMTAPLQTSLTAIGFYRLMNTPEGSRTK